MSQVGAKPITAPGWTGKPKNGVAIVDCDVHHNFRNPEQLLPYLSTFNQEHLLDQGLHLGGYPNIPIRTNRTDLKGRMKSQDVPAKRNTGGDPRDFNFTLEFLQETHLDPWNIDYGAADRTSGFLRIFGTARSGLGCRTVPSVQRLDDRTLARPRRAYRQRHPRFAVGPRPSGGGNQSTG